MNYANTFHQQMYQMNGHPMAVYDAESTQSQFSNVDQFDYSKDTLNSTPNYAYGHPNSTNYGDMGEQMRLAVDSNLFPATCSPTHDMPNFNQSSGVFSEAYSSSQANQSQMNVAAPQDGMTYPEFQQSIPNIAKLDAAPPEQAKHSDNLRNAVDGSPGNLESTDKTQPSTPRTSFPTGGPQSRGSAGRGHGGSKRQPKLGHSRSKTKESGSRSAVEQADPFTQWYQMMSQYYSQFYPGYQLPQPPAVGATTSNSASIQRASEQQSRGNLSSNTSGAQGKLSVRMPHQSNVPALPQAISYVPPTAAVPGGFDYANYYYQYYYGAAATAAAQMWSDGSNLVQPGRQTPKIFPNPHIKACMKNPGLLLQVVPSRPLDGELARVELVDLSELANEAVAEATKRASEFGTVSSNLNRLTDLRLEKGQETPRDAFSSGASGLESPGHLSSFQAGAGGDDDGEEARACAAVALAWDRTDHVFYPGPLSRTGTLKADVLAFLRDKLAEIQDRLPIDWESAGLLIAYLEALVKNNGNVQPTDLVNLLLEGHEPQTSELRARSSSNNYSGGSYAGISPYNTMGRQNRSYLNDSLASLPPSQVPSGRQSPQGSYPIGPFQTGRAASETGGFGSTSAVLRRAAAAAASMAPGQLYREGEDKVVDRYRELLMHGMTMKALEHACRSQLWGHAFVLAQRIGPAMFTKVMERFLNRAVPMADPILTLYQITAGELPQAVTSAAYGRGADNGEWRPHLAMILAAEATQPELAQTALERLGDCLLSRRLVYAAHLCYLLMGPLVKQTKMETGQPIYELPEKIWLLGYQSASALDTTGTQATSAPSTNDPRPQSTKNLSPLVAPTEAIQLTEIYEYAMRLANRNYRLPQLLPFRLVYATRLIDAGLLDKAYRYLAMIGTQLISSSDFDVPNSSPLKVDPVNYSLVENCLRLAEPLHNHPELDAFEAGAGGRLGTHVQSRIQGNSGLPNCPIPPSDPTYSGVNGSWLDRLRRLYDRMNKVLGYPSYGMTNLRTYVTPYEPAVKKESDNLSGQNASVVELLTTSQPENYQPVQEPYKSTATSSSVGVYGPPEIASTQQQQQRSAAESATYASGRSEPPFVSTTAPSGLVGHSVDSSTSQHYPTPQCDVQAYPHQQYSNTASQHTPQSFIPQHQNMTLPARSAPQQLKQENLQPSYGWSDRVDSFDGKIPTNWNEPNLAMVNHDSTSPPHSSSTQQSKNAYTPASNHFQPKWDSSPISDVQAKETTSKSVSVAHMPPAVDSQTQPQSVSQQPSNNTFFVPVPSNQSTQNDGTTAPVFDYFSGPQYQTHEKSGNRSRTVSGCSQGSGVGTSSGPHSGSQQGATRSRNSSGVSQPRRNSSTSERQPQPSPQQSYHMTQSPRHGSVSDVQRQPIKEEPRTETSAGNVDSSKNKGDVSQDQHNNSKDGWFSGWFGRLRGSGGKNIHLPDDSKPSIVWDAQRKQWIDVNNPEPQDATPPPPPLMMSAAGGQTNMPCQPTDAVVRSLPNTSHNFRPSLRSRYVNVLANQNMSSSVTKTDNLLQPPLPRTVLNPQTTAYSQASGESGQRQVTPLQSSNPNSNYSAEDGNSGLRMYH
ncbi:unnamed protein product [Calicophoron daubneyi]|uniref:Sec16 Sec23-binding domain-containing protein n=1 Tax=Calicophoron daubneyi TaxID=300641 RepID=A0AAV2SYS3_CALDB